MFTDNTLEIRLGAEKSIFSHAIFSITKKKGVGKVLGSQKLKEYIIEKKKHR